MKANELRIGNWVNFMEDDTRFKVGAIEADGIGVSNAHESTWIELDQFGGIKLTPEILEKCKIKPNDYFREGEGVYWFTGHNPEVPIQYVHQLQNLFFILKGQELQIDLT